MALECAVDLALAKQRAKYGGTKTYQDYMAVDWAAAVTWTGSIDSKKSIMKAALALVPVSVPATAAIQDIEYLYWKNVTL